MNPINTTNITIRLLQLIVALAAICSFAAVAQAQAPDLSGTWKMYDERGTYIPNDATITQLGASVTLDNGHGSVVPTTLMNDNTVSAWGLLGTVKQNGNRIEWSNGYVWVKIPSQVQTPQIFSTPAPSAQATDLNGKWKMYDEHGTYIPQDATISQSGTSVSIDNGHGSIVPSSIVNNTVSAWNLTGNIIQSGWRIEWSNGYVWTKIRNTTAATVEETRVELPADQSESQSASIPARTIQLKSTAAYSANATLSRPRDAEPAHSGSVLSGQAITVQSAPGIRADEPVELRIYMEHTDDQEDLLRKYTFRANLDTSNICYQVGGTLLKPTVSVCDSSLGEGVEPAHIEFRNESFFESKMSLYAGDGRLLVDMDAIFSGGERVLYIPMNTPSAMNVKVRGVLASPDTVLDQPIDPKNPPKCFKTWGSLIAPKAGLCSVEGSARLLTLKNMGGWNARMDVTYYNTNRPLIGETPVTVSTNIVELGGEETIIIPRGSSTTPVDIVIRRAGATRDEGTIALRTTLPYDFTDSHCYRTEGTVFQPTGATCEGDANPLAGNTRQIQFKNIAAFDAALEVTYIESNKVNGVKTETPKTVTTGFINAGVTRIISVPAETAKNKSITARVIGNATVRNDIFFGKIPANFSTDKTPCIKVWGTVFQPVGGPCTATTPVTEDRTITFYNTAGFTAKLMVMYYPPPNAQGISMPLIFMSEDLPSGQGKSFLIPESAPNTKVTVKLVGISTLNDDFFSEVLDGEFTGLHCYKAWGTLFSPQGGKCD
ncbi:MAG: hypothetical protein ABIP75_05170 [Pyrinomonadaceae bacterium]